jgi:hypothetical protein
MQTTTRRQLFETIALLQERRCDRQASYLARVVLPRVMVLELALNESHTMPVPDDQRGSSASEACREYLTDFSLASDGGSTHAP